MPEVPSPGFDTLMRAIDDQVKLLLTPPVRLGDVERALKLREAQLAALQALRPWRVDVKPPTPTPDG